MDYTSQMRNLAVRLSSVNQALAVWEQIEAQAAAPHSSSPCPDPPNLDKRSLKSLLVLLIADMCRLEQEIAAASLNHSLN